MRREDPTTTPTPRKRMRVADGCVFHPGVTDAAKERRAAGGRSSPCSRFKQRSGGWDSKTAAISSYAMCLSLSVRHRDAKKDHKTAAEMYTDSDLLTGNALQQLGDFFWQWSAKLWSWSSAEDSFWTRSPVGVVSLFSRMSHICHMHPTHTDA